MSITFRPFRDGVLILLDNAGIFSKNAGIVASMALTGESIQRMMEENMTIATK